MVCLLGFDELWLYDLEYSLKVMESLLKVIMHDYYSFVFLSDLSIIALYVESSGGEVLCSGFNLVVSSPSDNRGSKARFVLLPLRLK